MNALKRILAMVMVIAMLMSMAVAEGDVVMIDQSGELHVQDEYAVETAEADAPEALEEIAIDLPEEPVEDTLVAQEEPIEEIPVEVPVIEEASEAETGLAGLPGMIEEEQSAEMEGEVETGDLIQSLDTYICDHDESCFSYAYTEKFNIEWTEITELEHSGTCDTIDWYYCSECCTFVERGGETGVSFTESHNWQQGVDNEGNRTFSCNDCEYINTCEHDFEVTDTWRINEEYTDNGDGTHTATFGDGWEEICNICGAEWTGNSEDVQTIVESHKWNGYYDESKDYYGATCRYCDVENTCEHVLEVTTGIVDGTGRDAEDNGDGTHTRYYYVYEEYTCTVCGIHYGKTQDEVSSMVEEHTMDYGYCTECGYEMECEHPNAQPEYTWRTNFEWSNLTAEGHSCTYDIAQEYYCPDCGDWYSEITETGLTITNEAHDWSTWIEEIDGVETRVVGCCECEYQMDCDHNFLQVDTEPEWEFDYSEDGDNGDGTHTLTYYNGVRYECEHCGVDYWTTDWDNGYEVTEAHSWWYDEEYGETSCRMCGAMLECDHVFYVNDTWRNVETRKDNGDGTHTISYYLHSEYKCEACGASYTEYSDELLTVTEAHEYSDGVCYLCNAKNPCAHANLVQDGTSSYYDAVVHSSDATTHTISAYSCIWYYCPDCGESFADVSDEYTTVNATLPHEWTEEGYCWICDAENPCEHPDLVYSDSYTQIDWNMEDPIISTTATTHTVWAYECEGGECPDCGAWVYRQIGETVQRTEAHEYYGGTYCNVCDYVPSCKHGTCVTSNVLYYIDGGEKVDNTYHLAKAKIYTVTTCVLCGYSVEKAGSVEYSFMEEHYYNDSGACYACGLKAAADCTHANTESYSEWEWSGSFSTDAYSHTGTEQEIEIVRCADCGKTISRKVIASERVSSVHQYDISNVCTECGYVSKCSHAKYQFISDSYTYYNALNANQHAPIVTAAKVCQCTVCGAALTYCSTVTQAVGKAAYHNWVNGECSVCYLPQPGVCQHKYVDGECTKCGAVCSHSYVDGVCTVCGIELVYRGSVTVNGLDENNSIKIGYLMPYQLNYDVEPAGSDAKLSFTTSNRYIASVDANGLITGTYPGSAVITISPANGVEAFKPVQFTVVVDAVPTSVDVQDAPRTGDLLAVGETVQLNPTVLPAGVTHSLTWSSSHPAVATVDENGLVTGVGPGLALIAVKTQNGKMDGYLVKVAAAPEKMDLGLEDNHLTMGLGMVYQINPVMTPVGAGSEITYVSSNPEIASVDAAGRVTAVSKGEVEITVSTWGLEDQVIDVQVKEAPKSVSFARTAITASLTEKTLQLKPIIEADEGTKFTWISGNNKIASVDQNGLVTFHKMGIVLIAAVAHNGKFASCLVTVMPYAPSKITVEPAVVDLLVGESKELKISFGAYEGCSELKISESEYFTYEDGILTAKKVTNGPVELVFEAPNSTEENPVKGSCTVNIYPELDQIALTANGEDAGDSMKLSLGQLVDLGVQRWDVNGDEMFAGNYTLESDNIAVATILAGNKLYVRGIGKATITVKSYNNKVDTLSLETVAAPYYVTMDPKAAILGMGEKMELNISHVYPESPTTYTVVSTNEAVAKVLVEDGKYYVVAGERMGFANIVVATHNGKYASCRIAVYCAPTAVTLDKSELTLAAGETAKLTTSLQPQYSASAISWKSSDESVAIVENGEVKAVGAGTATITAQTYNSTADAPITASCEVTVKKAPVSAEIVINETMSVGQNQPVKVILRDEDGNETAGAYTVESNYPLFALIYNGSVYARYATLEAYPVYLTVKTYNDVETKVQLNIVAAPYYVTMDPKAAILGMGEKMELNISHVYPEAPTTYTVVSTNEAVAKVLVEDGKYYVVAGERMGFANIVVATHNGKYASCRIAVYNAPSAVTLDKTELTLAAGESAKLTTSLQPLYSASAITWKSSDESVAIVENGEVKAVGAGSATITAQTYNSTADAPITASCEVTVKKAPASIRIEMAETMSVGQNQPVKVTLLDEDGNETTGAYTVESNLPVFAMIYNGSVYARYASLEAYPIYITVKAYNAVEAKVQLNIVAAPVALQFAESRIVVSQGEKISLPESLKVIPEGTPTSYAYASSNAKVVAVNANGEMEAVGAGVARITVATHNGKYAFLWVTVEAE